MRARTLAELITQKNQRALANALTATSQSFPIACAHIAGFMMDHRLYVQKTKSSPLPTIGIDLMGSDEDSSLLLTSLIPILNDFKNSAHFVLFGEEKNRSLLASIPFISYQISPEVVLMGEDPLLAVRRKKKSSLHTAMKALKTKTIQAFISMGNTGALMATARIHLKTLPKISRPALLTLIPSKNKETVILDVGANSECKSSHLVGFAAMGVAYQKARGIENPSAGLLNIGEEAVKGPPELQKAYKALAKAYPFFHGNIEGRDAFEGVVDVLVTDGFTGNIFLKTSEGIARVLLETLSDHADLKHLKKRLDYSEYPGALLAGVNGIVIKCHGTANSASFPHSLTSAITLLKRNFIETLEKEISFFFSKED
jgi:phosphate acyltransferase